MALRDEIKAFVAAEPVPLLAVPTPELPQWDGQIFVMPASAKSLSSCWANVDEEESDERARFVQLVACDKNGSRIFQPEDVVWLGLQPLLSPVLERLYWAGRYVNGLTAENREGWRKNLPDTALSGSPSSSAGPSTPATVSTSAG